MKYYSVEDVMEITGTGPNKSYEIIRKLRKSFEKKYPDAVSIQGKILKWYFDEMMGINGGEQNETIEIENLD